MKITCFIILNILLTIRFGQCQTEPENENSFKEDRITIPQKDSSVLKYRPFPYDLKDSNATGRILRRKQGQKPYSERFNDDMIVVDPRPFWDNMPNANVTVPGVYYHLKIKGIPEYRTNPRRKFR